jgi:AcrR family transcriptional regulator
MITPKATSTDYSEIVPDERRRRLLQAAMEVMAKDSLENVTMERIAREAKVTRVTLYREFGNRGTLIEAVIAFRLMLFDENFFDSLDGSLDFADLVQHYLTVSALAAKRGPLPRRWARGGMKFLHSGSLIHRVAVATWTPILTEYNASGAPVNNITANEMGLWLIILQYSLGRMVFDTGCDEQVVSGLVRQFVSPAFLARGS